MALQNEITKGFDDSFTPDLQLQKRSLLLKHHGCTDLNITISEAGEAKYFLEIHRRQQPDISVHKQDANGEIVAVSHIRSWSKAYHIGLGPQESREWTDFSWSIALTKKVGFSFRGKNYTLTRGAGISRWRGFTVMCETTNTLVAEYKAAKEVGKQYGAFTFESEVSLELQMLIILAVCSWKEEMRRAG